MQCAILRLVYAVLLPCAEVHHRFFIPFTEILGCKNRAHEVFTVLQCRKMCARGGCEKRVSVLLFTYFGSLVGAAVNGGEWREEGG
jgi:hypothetical protein